MLIIILYNLFLYRVVVWKDLTANKVELKGIFNEARVKRGRDWDSGEEDTSVHLVIQIL